MSKEIRMTLELVEKTSKASDRVIVCSRVIRDLELYPVDYHTMAKNVVRFVGETTAEDFVAPISGQSEEKKR